MEGATILKVEQRRADLRIPFPRGFAKRLTGRKASFALTVPSPKSSTCCKTGSGARLANTSPGSKSTGSRFTCASAAAVTRFSAPGPIEVVTAIARRRFIALA